MLKRNAIVKFVFLAIIAILGILLCVCPFNVPYSSKTYNGFLKSINKGTDLAGGVSAIYECNLPDGSSKSLSDAIDSSLSKIEATFKNEKFSQIYVERQGGNKVYILASNDATVMNKSFYYIEDGKPLFFTAAAISDTVTQPEVYLTSKEIKSVKPDYNYDSSSYGVTIEFTKEGLSSLSNLKNIANESSEKKVYLYLGELSADNLLVELSTSDIKNKETTMFISAPSGGNYSTSTAEEARAVAYKIAGGMLDVELSLKEVSPLSAILGKNTMLYIGICLLVTVILTLILLCVRYGELGLVGSLALVFFFVLFAFFMQAIPFITLTLSGVVGSIFAFLFAAISISLIFEKIREEYAIGKKIHLSCKGGFKKALWPIVDSHVLVMCASLFIWVIAPSSMKCFAITLILGSLLSLFITLLLLRWFVNIYLNINSTKASKMRLYRDKSIKELKEEEVALVVEEKATNNEEILPETEEVSND